MMPGQWLFSIKFQMADKFLEDVVILVWLAECQHRQVSHLVAIHNSGTAETVHSILQSIDRRTLRCS